MNETVNKGETLEYSIISIFGRTFSNFLFINSYNYTTSGDNDTCFSKRSFSLMG